MRVYLRGVQYPDCKGAKFKVIILDSETNKKKIKHVNTIKLLSMEIAAKIIVDQLITKLFSKSGSQLNVLVD